MIPRAEIEFTLKVAEAGARCEAPAKVMEELCRVYLAWLDAPEVTITDCNNPIGALPDDWREVTWDSFPQKRVKLVEVPDVGG